MKREAADGERGGGLARLWAEPSARDASSSRGREVGGPVRAEVDARGIGVAQGKAVNCVEHGWCDPELCDDGCACEDCDTCGEDGVVIL